VPPACGCCFLLQSVTKDSSGQVTAVTAELNPGGDFKKTKLKLTWLADVTELVPLVLTEFDYLITKKKVCAHERSAQLLVLALRLLPSHLRVIKAILVALRFPKLVSAGRPHGLDIHLLASPAKCQSWLATFCI